MRIISISPGSSNNPVIFNKEDNTFYGNERNIPFDTTYEIKNMVSGKSEIFEFSHSTGSEFDPKTQWVYKSKSGINLVVGNDEKITNLRAENYLNAKLRKN